MRIEARPQLIVALALLLSAFAPARAEFLEGVEYVLVTPAQPVITDRKIEVREVFMYGCPHCFNLEPTLNRWLKTKPANSEFVRMPAVFRPTLEPHARAFYAFQAMGMVEKLHGPFFRALHVDKQALNDEASIAQFVAAHGGKADEFRRAYHSFGVDAQVKEVMRLAPAYGVDSVPTFIVDGKYRTNATMAQGGENLMRVIEFLIKKSAAERKRGKTSPR